MNPSKELTDCEHGQQEEAGDDAGDELAARRCAANERHHLASVAPLALPVVGTVLPSPLTAAVSPWTAVDLICQLLNFRIHEGILLREWHVCGVAVVSLGWCPDLLLRDRAHVRGSRVRGKG